MSDTKLLSTNAPEYVTMDEKAREEFLSDLGTFSPAEREIFHRLCMMWAPEIPYSRAAGGISSDQNTLDRLLEKLRARGYGLVRTAVEGRRLEKTAVVLTGRWDRRFAVTLLDEEVSRLIEDGGQYFATEDQLIERGVAIPSEFISDGNYDALARAYTDEPGNSAEIFRLKGLNGATHLVSARFARRFVTGAMERVRTQCVNATLLELLAKFRDASLTETRSAVVSKDPLTWLDLTTMLVDRRAAIDAKRNVVIEEGLYQAAVIVRGFLQSEIAETKRRKKAADERRADFAGIVQAIRESHSSLITQEELALIVHRVKPKYDDEFDEFAKEFYELALTATGKRSLPIILRLGDRYIHRDHILGEFRRRIADASLDLGEEYTSRMNSQLRHTSPSDNAFLSRDNFESDIAARIRAADSYLWQLLEKPGLFAEAVIQGIKREKGAATIDEIRATLSNYIDVGEGEFLPLSHLLDLNMVSIYETAFQRLPVLRQLFYRISGRYETYKGKYVGRTTQSIGTRRYHFRDTEGPPAEPAGLGGTRRRLPEGLADLPRSGGKARVTGGATPGMRRTGPNPHRRKRGEEPKPARPKSYSESEREAAWSEFGKTLKK